MEDVVAVILAGGVGKRFWPIKTSKPLFPFIGRPFLSYIIDLLVSEGFTKIVLVANPQDQQEFENLHFKGATIRTVIQKEANGMGDALLQAEKEVNGAPMFVLNGDDFVEASFFKNLVSEIKKKRPFIVGKRVERYLDIGYLVVENDRITKIVEKPGPGNEPSNLTSLVFDYFFDSAAFFKMLHNAKTDKDDVFEVALDNFFKDNNVGCIEYTGAFAPLKYPWHILDVLPQFLKQLENHKGKNVLIKNNVQIEGNVWIGDNVKILENTKIVGPAYIGNNTIIGNNNIIRTSQIGNDVITGFSTDITRSFIGDNCWFHTNYIGDSVLEGNITMGSGATLANLRLDDEEVWSKIKGTRINTSKNKLGAIIGMHTKIGVNASIMPGVKIGANCCIGASVVVNQDIEDESFVKSDTTLTIVKNTRVGSLISRDEFKKQL